MVLIEWIQRWAEVISLLLNIGIMVWGVKKYFSNIVRQYKLLTGMVEEHDHKLDMIIHALATSRTLPEAQGRIARTLQKRSE